MTWVMMGLIIGSFLGVMLVMDLIDRHLTRDERYNGERLTPKVAIFFMVVILVYLGIQRALFPIEPIEWLFTGLRDSVSAFTGVGTVAEKLSIQWLAVLSVVGLYIAGFYDYLFHRFVSHSKAFWFTHEYHHIPNQVFLGAPGIFARPFAIVIIFPNIFLTILTIYMILALSGMPLYDLSDLKTIFLLQGVVAIMSHSSCLRRWNSVHNVMRVVGLTTPHEHVLHHTTDLDGNFSNFTTLWDRVFGTYLDPMKNENKGRKLGLSYDRDFLQTVTVGLLRIPDSARKKFKIERYCNID